MKKHLIIGNPIIHSLSPKLHNYWFKKNNIDAIYEKKMTEANKINEIIRNEMAIIIQRKTYCFDVIFIGVFFSILKIMYLW